ncbi:MAG: DUF4129 domain-containing protein [Ardenticatenaceae bacterium]|nr:DUF4129 domain-containing protein [Anaerolineales bacterium]MCB8920533.1 DUF4129 domain-containing protein [Ardenticatenaceae bacterium]
MNKTSLSLSEYATGVWAGRVLQPIAMTVLVTAVFLGLSTIAEIITGDTYWTRSSLLISFVALETIYTTFWIEHPRRRLVARNQYRLAEFGLLFLITRIFVWFASGQGIPTVDDFRLYLREPLSFFSESHFIFTMLFVLAAWQFAVKQASIFRQLAISPEEARYYSLPAYERSLEYNDKPILVKRSTLVKAFFRQWLWGGIVLVFIASMSTLELASLSHTAHPWNVARLGLRPSLLGALISYFLAGLWLLSQGRMQVMNARWLFDGVQKETQIRQQWQRNSLIVLLVMALIAAFLPIGSTLPISRILQLVVGAILYVGYILYYLFSLLFLAFLSLFRSHAPTGPAPPPTPTPLPTPALPQDLLPQQSQQLAPPSETAALLMSSYIWTLAIFLVVTAVLYFLRERDVTVNKAALRQWWQRALIWLRQLWQSAASEINDLRQSLRRPTPKLPEAEQDPRPSWQFVRVNGLPPREQVRYFYLSVVRRAGETGVPRQKSETPLEYATNLKERWPEHEHELEDLTQAFLAARYSAHPIEKSMANTIKNSWKRISHKIRHSKNAKDN